MRLVAAALAVAALLALPGVASASSVGRFGAIVTYAADPGEVNRVHVELSEGSRLLITDAGARIRIADGSGCSELEPDSPGRGAECPVPAGTVLAASLADGHDSYVAEDGVTLPQVLAGQEGGDSIQAGDGADTLSGGPGDDRLDGGAGGDVLRGEEDADLLRGGPGSDDLDGGPGDDRVDARSGGGVDAVSCASGGDDALLRGRTERIDDCGPPPRASLRLPRQRIRAFFDDDGLDFKVRCAQPCAIAWEIVPRDRSTRRRIHQRDRRLDRAALRRDAEGFPRYRPGGWHELHARPIGRTTRRDVAAARVLRLRLEVTVVGRNGLQLELGRSFTLRR